MPKKDVKLSQNVNGNGKKKKKKNKRLISKFMTIFMIISLALLIFQIIKLNLLPAKLIVLVSLVMIILCLIIILIFHFKAKKFLPRILAGFVALCMCVGLAYGNYFIYKTDDTFDVVTSLADSKATMTSIVVLKSSSIKKEKDLKGKTIGTILDMDKVATKRMLKDLDSDNIKYKTKDYSTLDDMMEAFYAGEVDAICLNEKYRDILHESEAYFNFQTDSRVVHQNVHYTKVEKNDNPSDPVNDISKDAFTILVSGNDSYGTLQDSNTRSDANLLLTVNPKTGTILMTSIPRDYYVELVCPEDDPELACPEGSSDKLTHSGLMGVKSTEETIEKALGIKINYNVRINFSSVVNLVDALDGIDLDIKKGEEVDIFYVNSQPGLSVGKHHVDGETALAFARERHAYLDGDNQRVRNQQKVFKAIFKRIVSPKMITNYGKFMDALAVAFDTNLSGDEISNFVKYELNNMPDWKIESYAIVAEPDYQFCYQSQSYASVVQQNDIMNEVARKKIEAVLNGKSSTTVEDPSGYSQTASEDNAVGNTEELQSMGAENEQTDYDYDYDQSYDDTDYYNPDDQYYQENTYEESDYQ
ncbi:MAG: LCP family protein [Holdemanella sp.]|uniref:LCP family protein n=1 Tax=Holdemanella sp. TaxID=1971762 RepID=UPI002E76D3A6|nr:LCP family protein [Holdemanella sp.]MEE0079837.1 LCP family protein [Holdemanella sp.]